MGPGGDVVVKGSAAGSGLACHGMCVGDANDISLGLPLGLLIPVSFGADVV